MNIIMAASIYFHSYYCLCWVTDQNTVASLQQISLQVITFLCVLHRRLSLMLGYDYQTKAGQQQTA